MKKGIIPAAELKFEEIARRDLSRRGVLASLDQALLFWRLLPKMRPSPRRRLIVECLTLSAEMKLPVPGKLIPFVERELKTSASPRDRVQAPGQMERAARHLVRHPGSSLSTIAKAIGAPGKDTTVDSYLKRPEFWQFCAQETVRYDREEQYNVLADYERRFGRFDYCDKEDVALCYLVPEMRGALKKGSAIDQSSIEGAVEAYEKALQPDSLKKALLRVHQ